MLYRKESIIIHRKLPEVFNRAQDIASSLEDVSAYKKVEMLKASGENISHRSTIRIFGIPVSYISETVIKQNESIDHRQIKGPLPGLRTTWMFDAFDAIEEDTRVTISHQLDLKIPVIGRWLECIVYTLFIKPLAENFLVNMKQNMEVAK
ncbi:MAG: SRPBCC family protein [bacterium]|nr:SRPBCC family protein [bacterium]